MLRVALLLALAAVAVQGYYINPALPVASEVTPSQEQQQQSTEAPVLVNTQTQYQHDEPAAVAFWADRIQKLKQEGAVEPTQAAANSEEETWLNKLVDIADPYASVSTTEAATSTTTTTSAPATTTTTSAPATTTTVAAQAPTAAAYQTPEVLPVTTTTTTGVPVTTTTSAPAMTSTVAAQAPTAAAYQAPEILPVTTTTTAEPVTTTTTPAMTTTVALDSGIGAYGTSAPQDPTSTAAYTTVAPQDPVTTTVTPQAPITTAATPSSYGAQPQMDVPTIATTLASQYQLDASAAAAYWRDRINNGFPNDVATTASSPLDQESVYGTTAASIEKSDQLLTDGSGLDVAATYTTQAATTAAPMATTTSTFLPQDSVIVPAATGVPQIVLPQQQQQVAPPMFFYAVPAQPMMNGAAPAPQQPIFIAQPGY